jgi:hypothetical protein
MTQKLLKNKLATASMVVLFAALAPIQMSAQKKVAYLQFSKSMDATASQTGSATVTGSDAITRMLSNSGFTVKVFACDANGKDLVTNVNVDTELTGYDLIVIQESWASGGAAIKQTGILALKKLPLPVIYNKAFTFANAKAISSAAAAVVDTPNLSVTVDAANKSNALYSGITFPADNSIPLFKALATDPGLLTGGAKSIAVVNNVEISAAGTLLATVPQITASANSSILINDIPEGTKIGTDINDVTLKRMFVFGFNWGAIAAGDGKNVTSEFLTIWRNAALILTGQTAPSTLFVNPTLGVNENNLAANSISVTPNPTKGLVTVNGVDAVQNITVSDVNGKTVLSKKNTTSVDLSNQAAGLYFVKVQTANGATTKKIVVE